MGLASVVQNAFRGRRLARIDVGHDANVSDLVDRSRDVRCGGSRHGWPQRDEGGLNGWGKCRKFSVVSFQFRVEDQSKESGLPLLN